MEIDNSGKLRIRTRVEGCAGHARCAAVAPSVYDLNSDGYNVAPERIVSASLKDEALRGARACPERIITVETIE